MATDDDFFSDLPKRLKAVAKNATSAASACLDQHHAVKSMNENGTIAHHGALARVLFEGNEAHTESEAVEMASVLVKQTQAISRGELWNREARMLLDEDARKRAHANPKATQPSGDLKDAGALRTAGR